MKTERRTNLEFPRGIYVPEGTEIVLWGKIKWEEGFPYDENYFFYFKTICGFDVRRTPKKTIHDKSDGLKHLENLLENHSVEKLSEFLVDKGQVEDLKTFQQCFSFHLDSQGRSKPGIVASWMDLDWRSRDEYHPIPDSRMNKTISVNQYRL